MGDSMIEDLITEGDVVIMRPVPEPDQLKMAPSLRQE